MAGPGLRNLTYGVSLLELPHGTDGRETVSIAVDQIAALRSHVVTSYSYIDYTEVRLKDGSIYDCPVKYSVVLDLLKHATTRTEDPDA